MVRGEAEIGQSDLKIKSSCHLFEICSLRITWPLASSLYIDLSRLLNCGP